MARSPKPPLIATLVATVFGAGFAPVAPGTAGTLVAVPLAWALGRLGWPALALGAAVVTAAGTWAAGVYLRATGIEDDQHIVIDEVAGYLVTMLPLPPTPGWLLAGFILFRILDTWKPPPIRAIDERVGGGWGVMADDLLAGVYGAALLLLAGRIGTWTGLWAKAAARLHN